MINVKTCTSFFSQKSLIECGSLSAPPNDGCLQYHTGTTGIIKSFNSDVAAPMIISLAANDINYNICIRQEAGKLVICFLESIIILTIIHPCMPTHIIITFVTCVTCWKQSYLSEERRKK